jgi:hypothetical protein
VKNRCVSYLRRAAAAVGGGEEEEEEVGQHHACDVMCMCMCYF